MDWMIGTDRYDILHFVHSTAKARFRVLTAVVRKIQVFRDVDSRQCVISKKTRIFNTRQRTHRNGYTDF